jgi:class 3 adenylate cyclase
MIASAQGLGDFRRAGEWTDEANRWCDKQDISGFPGVCRVHRAEAMRLRGDWDAAEAQAEAACEEVGAYNVFTAASGYYELGEIRRRRGDFAAAEEAYRKAKELGRSPEPGLSLLRLAQGKVDAAASGIKRALASGGDAIARARRLPAQVEIGIEAGELKFAREAAAELEQLADEIQIDGRTPPALLASARLARGQVAIAEGDFAEAASCFEETRRLWEEVGAPYEVAHAQMHIGLAFRRAGDEDGARDEFRAAVSVFERLGAVLDAQRVRELLGDSPTQRTFVFTDMVDSTKLVEALGEEKWKKLLTWHDKTLRDLITERGGEVIKQTGDGYFAAFHSAGAALEAAVAVQRALDSHEGIAPDVRIGVHTGGALTSDDGDYSGQGVHMAARIGALAGAGEILVSRETLTDGAARFALSQPRAEELKGFSEPVELVSVGWR